MKITLEGVAGKRFGREHNLAVRNPNEALRALCQLIPGFREFLTCAHEHGIFFQVITNNQDRVDYEGLGLNCSSFSLVPVITGALNFSFKNIGLILVGALLVAISMGAFGITYGAVGTISYGMKMAAFSLGMGLIFTGIAGIFAPGVPEGGKQEGREADDAVFAGGTATSSQGTAIPILYGEFLVQNMPVISSYIDKEQGHILQIISEGQIEGLASGNANKDIYFNGLQSGASSVDLIKITDGTQTDKVITKIDSAGFHVGIGATLQPSPENDPNPQIIRSFNQPDADKLQLRILRGPSYQVKQSSPKSGGEASTSYERYDKKSHSDMNLPSEAQQFLRWNIRVQDANGNILYNEEVRDHGPLKARKVYDIPDIDISGAAMPVSMSLVRLDKGPIPDPESHEGGANQYSFTWVKGDVQFVSADVFWEEDLVYPNSALLGLRYDVGEFTQMPSVQGLFRGIKVPTLNSNLVVSYAWSDNPAYVLLDLLTNPRYGCGLREYELKKKGDKVVEPGIALNDIDLGSFRKAAEYCDDKKITFNAYVNRKSDALDLIRSVAATFQGSLIYAGGYVSLIIDKKLEGSDREYFRLYSEANVIQETDDSGEVTEPCFVYEGTARRARTTAVEVSYVEPREFYTELKESIEDRVAIERYGYNQKTIRALGCTSREQARRLGRYILGSNQLNTETVSFSVGTEGAMLLPGDICLIADPLKTRITGGGRIVAGSTNSVIVDRDITGVDLSSGSWYLYIYGNSGIAERSHVKNIAGSAFTVSGFNNIPTTNQMWILVNEDDENVFRRYRVQSVKENSNGVYEVTGVSYTHDKWDYVDDNQELDYGKATTSYKRNKNPGLNPKKINFSIRNLET